MRNNGKKYHTADEKLAILNDAKAFGDITKTCLKYGISRNTFYRYKKAYQKDSFKGLEPKEHRNHPQTTKPAIVQKIERIVLINPSWGSPNISKQLMLDGIKLSPKTIQNHLHKNGFGTKYDRCPSTPS